jgi:transcriptional antiterminator NusG
VYRAWYAVHTFAGHENKVRRIIERRAQIQGLWDQRIFKILIPTEQELRTRGGKRTVVQRNVFPGYILVEMTLDDDTWALIKSTSGVTGFVSSGEKPVPLSEREVKDILDSLDTGKAKPRVSWKRADTVRVTNGPFADLTGKIDEVDVDREKLRVLINIFGRDTPVELEFTDVEKI